MAPEGREKEKNAEVRKVKNGVEKFSLSTAGKVFYGALYILYFVSWHPERKNNYRDIKRIFAVKRRAVRLWIKDVEGVEKFFSNPLR